MQQSEVVETLGEVVVPGSVEPVPEVGPSSPVRCPNCGLTKARMQ